MNKVKDVLILKLIYTLSSNSDTLPILTYEFLLECEVIKFWDEKSYSNFKIKFILELIKKIRITFKTIET